ncbi:tail fiber domain-containing protein [Akkermansiaceae bacterium]|nr:tail fiber domain-containing protein [Akkermansiaceae bacterium]
MTVSSTTTKVSYSGNGSTTVFAYTFKVFDEDDLTVILRNNATATETVQAINTNYSVSGVGNVNGGNITFVTAPASGVTVVVRRTSAQTQTTDYTPNDPFPAESHEEALDKLTFVQQEQQEEIDRSIKLSRTNTMTSTEFELGPTARANKVLSFDASGEISVAQELGTFKGNWSAGVSYSARDLVKDTSTNNIYLANAAHTSSGSQPLTTNTDSGKWELIVDAAAAATSATAAANSATAAANSASAASTSEGNAATSASTASTQATNAANSATSSANSATAASNAQAAAEAALDTFDDRFLGAKASDPTLDNDGNALLDGALYFDTTNDIMKVYDLANTQWRQLTLTSANQAFVNTVAGEISPTNNIATIASSINSGAFSGATSFAETYFVSATAPSSPTLGDLWFDTTNDIMKVYSASGFVNAGSSVNGTANRYVYTATASQTSFAATYDAGYVDVYLNGVKLQSGTDFTATDGANVVLTVGAALNDQIDIVGYGTFNIAIPDISGDLTPELGGDLATSGNDITFGDNDKAVFGAGNDLQIYHDGFNSFISDTGTGSLAIVTNGANVNIQKSPYEPMIVAHTDGAVDLYHNNALKLATTATGVDVTGATVTSEGGSASAPAYAITSGALGANGMFVPAANTLAFVAGFGTERLRIDSSGSVGVGTSSPSSYGKLVSLGGDNATLFAAVGSTNMLRVQGYNSTYLGTLLEAVNLAQSANTPMFVNASEVKFGINGSERMRIDSSGSVGIATSSPSGGVQLDVRGTGVLQLVNTDTVQLVASSGGSTLKNVSNNPLIFGTNNTERMRIDSGGKVGIGPSGVGGNRLRVSSDNPTSYGNAQLEVFSGAGNVIQSFHAGGATAVIWKHPRNSNVLEARNNADSGYININAAAFTVSSDYRLKENVTDITDATERLKRLNPVRFNFKPFEETGEEHHSDVVDGFLAHEVQDIVPEAISGTKDAMRDEEYEVSAATGDIYTPAIDAILDDDGVEVTPAVAEVIHSTDVEQPEELAEGQQWRETTAAVMGTRSVPDYQGIDQSKLTPLLTKALIEAVEKIEQLETRIAALENV